MSRRNGARHNGMRERIAAAAARIMAEEGIDDFALAKRKAARRLGAPDSEALPGNDFRVKPTLNPRCSTPRSVWRTCCGNRTEPTRSRIFR